MSRSKIWAWTINARADHPGEVPTAPVLRLNTDGVLFYKYQMESGDSGTKHIQGCIRFCTMKSLVQVKKILNCPWAHCEIARNWKALVDYCGKEDTRIGATVEEGSPGEQGKRTDLTAVASGIKSGLTPQQIAAEYPETYIKYPKGIQALAAALHEPRYRDNLKVFCLYGPTGVGKTFFVHKFYPSHYAVFDMKTPWFDGYSNHKTVLFDDYGPKMMQVDYLKRFLDKYKCTAPVKGASVAWNPELIFITTNHALGNWFEGSTVGDHDFAAIRRRMTWIELTADRIVNEKLIIDTLYTSGVTVPGVDYTVHTVGAAHATAAGAVGDATPMPDVATQPLPDDADCIGYGSLDLLRTDYVEPSVDQMILLRDHE